MILRHSYHRGLLLLSSSCYYLSVELVSELDRIVVLPHPDDLDEIHSDSADAPNRGVRLHLAVEYFYILVSSSYYCHLAPLGEQNRRSPPWQIWEISPSCGEFSDLHPSVDWQAHRWVVVEKMRSVGARVRPPEETLEGSRCAVIKPPHWVVRLCLGNTVIRATHQEIHPTLDTVLHHGMACIPPALNLSDLSSQPRSGVSASRRGCQGVDGTGDRRVCIASPPPAVQNT